MNNSHGVEIGREKKPEQETASGPRQREESTRFSIPVWLQRFQQLDWPDRLNLILAAILGCALVLALSPLFLVSWLCMHLARHGLGCRRPDHLRADRQA
jgi:hypothetical protein